MLIPLHPFFNFFYLDLYLGIKIQLQRLVFTFGLSNTKGAEANYVCKIPVVIILILLL